MAAVVLSDAVMEVVRRELRRAFPDVRVEADELRETLIQEVLKREVTEGDKADEARKRLARAQGKALRARSKAAPTDAASSPIGGRSSVEGGSTEPDEKDTPA